LHSAQLKMTCRPRRIHTACKTLPGAENYTAAETHGRMNLRKNTARIPSRRAASPQVAQCGMIRQRSVSTCSSLAGVHFKPCKAAKGVEDDDFVKARGDSPRVSRSRYSLLDKFVKLNIEPNSLHHATSEGIWQPNFNTGLNYGSKPNQ
jgi:hypothetical protein